MYAPGWYVGAMSHELHHELFGRMLLGEPVVMYRRADGTPIALEDRCLHRRLPLTKGKLLGDIVQCGYHGVEYESSGKCLHVPGQKAPPPDAYIKSYPVAERYGWVFLWMGDPSAADTTPVPEFSNRVDDPEWYTFRDLLPLKCNYKLVLDNLLDLSHLAYVHGTTTGNVPVAVDAVVETTVRGNSVRVTRLMEDVEPAMVYSEFGGFKSNINRWQITEYMPPSMYYINNGSERAGQLPAPAERIEGQSEWGFQVYHGITPETENTTHQFWQISYRKDAVDVNKRKNFDEVLIKVLYEDLDVYEAQQHSIELLSEKGRLGVVNPIIGIDADTGLTHGRRLLDAMVV
jgi:phenylpropionate dioxygenase-like ring-hydroxylating dioxygenase large terminal subunit